MKQLLIATQNRGKFAEFLAFLKDLPFEFISLLDIKIPADFSIKETGKSFSNNAILKAETYGRLSNRLTLADDSGLCVECLGGQPGFESHRYHDGSDEDRYRKLLREMENVPKKKRQAKFVSCVALFNPKNNKIRTTMGDCAGWIAFKPKGKFGFGFDPIFIVKGLNKHFAQLTLAEKNQISHRGEALRRMRKILLRYT